MILEPDDVEAIAAATAARLAPATLPAELVADLIPGSFFEAFRLSAFTGRSTINCPLLKVVTDRAGMHFALEHPSGCYRLAEWTVPFL